ncbi:MAG TPA: hypothetical protein VGK59_10980 [Ohtaekwangia sp.]
MTKTGKTLISCHCPLRDAHQEATAIVRMFNDPIHGTSSQEFRELIFRIMHDAYIFKENGILNDSNIVTLHALWNIINEVDRLKAKTLS